MSNVKSVEAINDQKLYQHQMLLSESKFNLQLIEIKKLNQESVLNLTDELTIQKQIIVENQTNQLCIIIQTVMKQNRKTCQDIDLNNC